MGEEEISAFLSHLAINRNVSASTQNQAFSALLFLYQQLLDRKLDFITGVERVRRPARVPIVFSKAEARSAPSTMRHKDLTRRCSQSREFLFPPLLAAAAAELVLVRSS